MSTQDAKQAIKSFVNISDISENLKVTLSGQDYLKFNQLVPNVVPANKMSDLAKKNLIAKLGIQSFIQIMDKVTLSGTQFVKADIEAILSEYVRFSSNDEKYAALVKTLGRMKPNEEGNVVVSAIELNTLLGLHHE